MSVAKTCPHIPPPGQWIQDCCGFSFEIDGARHACGMRYGHIGEHICFDPFSAESKTC